MFDVEMNNHLGISSDDRIREPQQDNIPERQDPSEVPSARDPKPTDVPSEPNNPENPRPIDEDGSHTPGKQGPNIEDLPHHDVNDNPGDNWDPNNPTNPIRD